MSAPLHRSHKSRFHAKLLHVRVAVSPSLRSHPPRVSFQANTDRDAVVLDGVARRFGLRWVLRGVSLRVAPGEAVGLLGHNGSGKSTLLRVISTALRANAGRGQVWGHDLASDADAVRAVTGFFAHSAGLYEDLSATENLVFAATMLGRPTTRVPAILERVGLTRAAHDRVRGFSAGMQRRLALGRLLLQEPRLLLLDEPYNNFDPAGIALMNEIIRDAVARGGSALIVLHDLAPAAGVLDRTVTMHDGRLLEGSAELELAVGAPSPPVAALAGGER